MKKALITLVTPILALFLVACEPCKAPDTGDPCADAQSLSECCSDTGSSIALSIMVKLDSPVSCQEALDDQETAAQCE